MHAVAVVMWAAAEATASPGRQSRRGNPIAEACGEIGYRTPIQAPTAVATRKTAKTSLFAQTAG